MEGADKAQKQWPMTEGCQEQNQVAGPLIQLKAVKKQYRRLKATVRALLRHAKQRRLSRAHKRTHRYDLHQYEEEAEWVLEQPATAEMLPPWDGNEEGDSEESSEEEPATDMDEEYNSEEYPPQGEMRRQVQGDPWENIDGQGWKIVAVYRNRKHRFYAYGWPYDRAGGGRFLAYNVHRRVVLLSDFTSGGGCSTCGNGEIESDDAMMDILGHPPVYAGWRLPFELGKPLVTSAKDFLDYAQRLVDPAMQLRRAMPEDVGYRSLDALYATYILFYSKVLSHLSGEQSDFTPVATWSPKEWTPLRYNAVVRLQAACRSWLFRQRVLYSPHTELGRRYLLRAWRRECSSQI
ncbi:hypothetical protein COCOBI_08-5100 [Coccomyxa sp. Obi]|nr:hypothetical protein COCOBI_08-5100 [Coccomyxa sp. Obi]